ncbi:MAG: ATP-binding protein [Candidatus Kapaibacterium sp.]
MKITHKLILFIAFSLVSIISIILISLKNTSNLKKKDNYKQIESLVSKASKDYSIFLKFKNIGLIERYNSNLENAQIVNKEIETDEKYKLIKSKIEILRDYTNETFEYWKLRGLDEDSGYEGDFRRNVHHLEDLLEKEHLDQLTISMLQVRRSEKDFILRRKEYYVDKVLKMINKLKKQTEEINNEIINKDSIILLSNDYKSTFLKLVKILETIDNRNISMNKIESDLNSILTHKIEGLNSEIHEFSKIMYVSYLLFIVSLAFISFVMYKRILNPISTLKMKTATISNGNYNDIVIYRNKDEIGEFTNSFNTMVRKFLVSQKELEDLNCMLDYKVKERTHLLQNEIEMRKKSEKKLELYNNEVKSLLEKEQQLSRLKTKFVATVSHEYRTPLTVILNSTYLIHQYALKNDLESLNNYLNKIQFSVNQMKDLLEDTLNYGEIENGNYKLNKTNFDIDKLIKNLIQDFKTINKYREIEYRNSINLKYIYSDKKALNHCLNNLIANAIKFSNNEIIIKVEKMEFDISISVMDFGIGIPEEDQDNIFSAFFRTNLAKNITGTGLGLSITKKYIDSLGGSIKLTSEVDKGSIFTLNIPYQKESLVSNPHSMN